MKIRNLFLTLLLAVVALPIAAQLENGKIYRFINKADKNIAMEASSLTTVYGSQKSDRYSHYWLAEQHPNNADAWSLRSLGNGLYLKPAGTSTGWTFANSPSASTVLHLITVGSYYTFNSIASADNSCMHYATSQGGKVVGWNTGADATLWSIEEVTLPEDEIAANWTELEALNNQVSPEFIAQCEQHLANLFSDKACTTLKKSFADVAELEADEDYQALNATLQAMVKKVYTDDWSEANFDSSKQGWDSEHGKRFRVQSIEPYSIAGEVTESFGINAHINMDNPTGITGNYRQHVYIFVEGEIKSGAELRVGSLVGHGLLDTYNNGTPLKEGLNVLTFHSNGNTLYINYVVHTYQLGRYTNKLSDYDNIKVHIAGGNVNGFFNGVGDHLWGEPDDDIDWQYYEDRTNTPSATLLGKRQILHFCMEDTEYSDDKGNIQREKGMAYYLPNNISVPASTPDNKKVNTMLEAWDRIHLSELATMGLISKAEMDSLNALYPAYDKTWKKKREIYNYSDEMYAKQNNVDLSEHFNHHGIALGNFSGYMSGGWRNCNYHHNTMKDIIGLIATGAGQAWGPAHEIGHQHQSVITVNGLTEVTNNFHSNVAVWYMGLGTSRVNGSEGSLERVYSNYRRGNHYLFHSQEDGGAQNLWTQTQMYYKLWLYYHRAGHKTDFAPILFELNRRNRMSNNNLGWIDGIGHASGTESMLKFYKHACEAAGEDLTEFFRAYGFFVLMDQKLRGDYSNSYYTQTQAEVDAAIKWVKDKGYRENLAPLFINDCVAKVTYSHDGKTPRSYWDDETKNGYNAKVGMYTDCFDKTIPAVGYLYKQTNQDIKIMSNGASGAIGFIIYSGDELVAFTNNYEVEIPLGITDFKVYAVQADGTKVELKSAAEGGNEAQQLEALVAAINSANTLLENVSTDGTNVAFVYDEETASLRALIADATAARNNKDQSVHTYGEWALILNNEVARLGNDKTAFVRIKDGNIYRLTSSSNTARRLAVDYKNSNNLISASNSQVPLANDYGKWEFVSTGVDEEFYIKNVGYNKYITEISTEQSLILSDNKVGSAKFNVIYLNGVVALLYNNDQSLAISTSGSSIIGANATSENSQWIVKLLVDNNSDREREELVNLIAKAENILTELSSDVNIHDINGNLNALKNELTAKKESAESNVETTVNVAKYHNALKSAVEAIENAYVTLPTVAENGKVMWFHIMNVEKGTYCGVDLVKTNAAYKNSISLSELDAEDRNFLWSFRPTENENEYTLFNAGQNESVRLYSKSPYSLKVDCTAEGVEPTPFLFTPDTENAALLISSGSKYWNSQSADNVRTGSNGTPYKLVYVCTEDATSIEDINADENVEGIFDLTGRRIEKVTNPGMYIINGKKVLVK